MSSPVDDYLAKIANPAMQAELLDLRQTVRSVLPDAEEVISYGIPALKVGKPVVWFGAFKNHCTLFAGHVTADFAKELEGYKVSKGGVQFTPDHPLRKEVVIAITKARLAVLQQEAAVKKAKKLKA